MSKTDNRTIARNTVFLYVRMLLIMAVSLYTSRVILEVLGVGDYGIYNLIAGFVTFLAFISNALVASMQRYFNVALGQNDNLLYKQYFSTSINILLLFSIIILVTGETIGLWFVKTQLNIPADRIVAANWVFQISLLTFVANTLRTPYHASIIAHEKMSFYAYISVIEVLLRLGVVFVLKWIPFDSLVTYAFLYLGLILAVNSIYVIYCNRSFRECRYSCSFDKRILAELLSFSGWTLFGQSAVIAKNQGEAILINRFFSVVANAALGIAMQVTSAIEMFVSNFQTAFNPQLTQTYARGDILSHKILLCRSSKFSFFLLLLLFLPVSFNIDYILKLWLIEVPVDTDYFVIFILISYLFNSLSAPLLTSILATGKIRNYHISLACIFLSGILVIYVVLKVGAPSYSVSVVAVFIQIFLLCARFFFANRQVGLGFGLFLKNVIVPVVKVSSISWIIPFLLGNMEDTIICFIFYVVIDFLYILIIIFLLGLTSTERVYIKDYIINKITRKLQDKWKIKLLF